MGVLEIILTVIVDLVALVIIGVVLLQPSERTGLGAIAGGAEQFLGKNKSKSLEARMGLITKIGAVAFFIVLTILLIVK